MWARLRSTISGVTLIAVAGLLLASGAAEACDVTISRKPADVILRYDPFDAQNAPVDVTFAIRGAGTEACPFDVALLDRDGRSQRRLLLEPSGLEVEFGAGATADTRLGDTSTPGVWRGSVSGGEREYHLTVRVNNDAVPPAGRLETALRLELRAAGAAAALETAMPFVLAIESPPRAQLNIAGASGGFGTAPALTTIDLGELKPGAQRRAFLQLRSNVAESRLTVRSEHRGVLAPREPGTDAASPGVPYHLVLDNDVIDLREPAERRVAAPRSIAGRSLPLDIVVDDFDARAAGAYSDTLDIDISPL